LIKSKILLLFCDETAGGFFSQKQRVSTILNSRKKKKGFSVSDTNFSNVTNRLQNKQQSTNRLSGCVHLRCRGAFDRITVSWMIS